MPEQKKHRKPAFTLAQIREGMAAACAAQGMRVPSLISIKTWSAAGLYRKATTLAEAIEATKAKMANNAGAYRRDDSDSQQQNAPLQTPEHLKGWLDEQLSRRLALGQLVARQADNDTHPHEILARPVIAPVSDEDEHPPPRHPDGDRHEDLGRLVRQLEHDLRKLGRAVREILDELAHQRTLNSGRDSTPPSVQQAIDRLDALAKMLLQRADAERSMRESTTLHHHAAAAAQVDNTLDVARLAARLGRIEDAIRTIAAKLNGNRNDLLLR